MKQRFGQLLYVLSGFGIASILYLATYFFAGTTGLLPFHNQTVVYESSTITKVAKQSLPSVVTIAIANPPGSAQPIPFNPFSPPGSKPPPQQQNIGSGFIVSSDGLILTNKHVVSDTGLTYKVISNTNKTYDVTAIYRDPLNDLAIVKIDQAGLSPLPLGDSSKLQLGQMVIAIGTPLGELQNTVSHGIVSGLGRGLEAGSPLLGSVEQLNNVIQTDAPINPGNSGGPLLDASGDVIGINTAIAEGGQSIGFSIPSNAARDLISRFRNAGSNFQQAFLGVRYRMITAQTGTGTSGTPEGALVIDVVPGSPADEAGIKQGDVITSFDGRKITGNDQNTISSLVLQKKVGDRVDVVVWRNSQSITKQLTLVAVTQQQ